MFFESKNDRFFYREPLHKFPILVLLLGLHFALWLLFNLNPLPSSALDISAASSTQTDEERESIAWMLPVEESAKVVSTPEETSFSATPSSAVNPQPQVKIKRVAEKASKKTSKPLPVEETPSIALTSPSSKPANHEDLNAADTKAADTEVLSPKKFDYGKVASVLKEMERENSVNVRSGREMKETSTEKLGREIAKSKRAHCETAYAHLGLLAIPFLVKDTVTDKGCKW